MVTDRLTSLLQDADADAGSPRHPDVADLVHAVRHRVAARRLRRLRRLSGASAAGLLLACAASWWWFEAHREKPLAGGTADGARATVTFDAQRLRDEIDRIERAIACREQVAQRTAERIERRRRVEHLLAAAPAEPADALALVSQEADRAAFILVRQADRMQYELGLSDSAAEQYRRTVELFPRTPWAAVARERLRELEATSHKGDWS